MSTEERDKARCCMFCRGDEPTTHSACGCHDRDQWWQSYLNRDGDGGDPERNAFDFAWDARGQVTPEEEAVKKVVLDAIYAERIEEGHPAKNTIRYELAEAITQSVLALFNEKGTP